MGGTAEIPEGADAILFTVTPDYSGPAGFTYTVQDNGFPPETDTAQFSFLVTAIAELPEATSASTDEDTLSTEKMIITAAEEDGESMTLFKVTNLQNLRLFHSDGTTEIADGTYITAAEARAGLRFRPGPDFNSTSHLFSFEVQAAFDAAGKGLGPARQVMLTVHEVNDPPTGVDDLLDDTILEDSGDYTIPGSRLTGNDIKGPANEEGQILTITDARGITGGSARVENGDVIFTPAPNFSGTASFEYTFTDNGTNTPQSATAVATLTVTQVLDAPRVILVSTTIDEDMRSEPIVILPSEVDPPSIGAFVISEVKGGTLYLLDGRPIAETGNRITVMDGGLGLWFQPFDHLNSLAGGIFGFKVQAAFELTATELGEAAPVFLSVREVNDPPTGAADYPADQMEDTGTPWLIPVTDLLANDLAGPGEEEQVLSLPDPTTLSEEEQTVGGTAALTADGTYVVFTPDEHFNGTARFVYILTDNGTSRGTPDPLSHRALVEFTVDEVTMHPWAGRICCRTWPRTAAPGRFRSQPCCTTTRQVLRTRASRP